MGKSEILNSYGNTISSSGSENYFHIIPEQATLKGYLDVFLLDSGVFNEILGFNYDLCRYCNWSGSYIVFQRYGLAKFNFPFKNVVFLLCNNTDDASGSGYIGS